MSSCEQYSLLTATAVPYRHTPTTAAGSMHEVADALCYLKGTMSGSLWVVLMPRCSKLLHHPLPAVAFEQTQKITACLHVLFRQEIEVIRLIFFSGTGRALLFLSLSFTDRLVPDGGGAVQP